MSGRRKKGEPMTLGELRDRIGASVWLLIAYCGMADTGREASDENLAELLKAPYGVETIARWREALVREGIVAVARGLDGGSLVTIYTDILPSSIVGMAQNVACVKEERNTAGFSRKDKEFLQQCGIENNGEKGLSS